MHANPGIKTARYEYCSSCLLGGYTLHLSELLSLLLLGGNCNKTFCRRLMLGVNSPLDVKLGLGLEADWACGACSGSQSSLRRARIVCACVCTCNPQPLNQHWDCLLIWACSCSLLMFTRGVQSSDSWCARLPSASPCPQEEMTPTSFVHISHHLPLVNLRPQVRPLLAFLIWCPDPLEPESQPLCPPKVSSPKSLAIWDCQLFFMEVS